MYISSISIKNFKCYKEIKLFLDPHFNLIIGGNNAGKSTILEAFRLWQLAFNKFLKVRTNQQSASFYTTQYFSFTIEDLAFLRINDFRHIFFNNDTMRKIEITLCLTQKTISIELPIYFTLTTEALNLRFELCKNANERIKASDKLLKIIGRPKGSSFKDTMLITYVNPIFQLPIKEEYHSQGLILEKLHQSKADEVIRNLINLYAPKDYQTKEKQQKKKELEKIEKDLDYIIQGDESNPKRTKYRLYSNFKLEKDSIIEIIAKNQNDKKVELAQLGSGTINLLNILTILSYGDYAKYNLNVLLLDEPDSHLHANHQKRLFKHLISVSTDENKQMFVITHNHELINCSERVLYIPSDHNIQELRTISCDEYYIIYKEIAPDYHKKMIELANSKKLISVLSSKLNEKGKPLIITEGKTDWKHFKHALKVFNENHFFEDLKLDFLEYTDEIEMGVSALKTMLKNISNIQQQRPIIGIFDSDDNTACQFVSNFQPKNNVYAILIDDYYHFNQKNEISVEMLYNRNDIETFTINNRRLYYSDEFLISKNTGCHKHRTQENIFCNDTNRLKGNAVKIIADKVINYSTDENLALSKEDFANAIYNTNTIFDDIAKLKGFKQIFEKIQNILD